MSRSLWWILILILISGCDGGLEGIARPDISAKSAAIQKPPPAERPTPSPQRQLWLPLAADYLHDPGSPALPLLQQPAVALSVLPRSKSGNYVDWVAALRSGDIAPRTNVQPETKVKLLDLDVLFEDTAGQPMVLFPHLPHTEWLDCSNCHNKPFIPKNGANPVNMLKILDGEYCGQCHGAVSFPLTDCARCHSVPRGKPPAS